MSRLIRIALVLALGIAGLPLATTATGCAKKAEPEAPAAGTTIELGKVELVRRATGTTEEQDSLRYVLRFTNSLQGAATIDKVEYSYGIGERELGNGSETPAMSVAVGDTGKIFITGRFEWRQDSEMPADNAFLKGTVYWTGPNGNARTSPFELKKAYEQVAE